MSTVWVRLVSVSATSIALSLTCASTASGAVFKCATPSNGVVYQDTPCTTGTELRNLDKDPPTLSVVPGLAAGSARAASAEPAAARNARGATADRREARDKSRTDKAVERAGERRFIRAGMSEADVLARIGRPDINAHKREKNDKRGSSAAQWSYLPNAGDPGTITTVTIAGGKVTDVRRSISR